MKDTRSAGKVFAGCAVFPLVLQTSTGLAQLENPTSYLNRGIKSGLRNRSPKFQRLTVTRLVHGPFVALNACKVGAGGGWKDNLETN
jgi:hypothetical protein